MSTPHLLPPFLAQDFYDEAYYSSNSSVHVHPPPPVDQWNSSFFSMNTSCFPNTVPKQEVLFLLQVEPGQHRHHHQKEEWRSRRNADTVPQPDEDFEFGRRLSEEEQEESNLLLSKRVLEIIFDENGKDGRTGIKVKNLGGSGSRSKVVVQEEGEEEYYDGEDYDVSTGELAFFGCLRKTN